MIQLVDITKYYTINQKKHYIFKNFNFEFPENENIGLMGLNGAGKTTLMNIIGGIDVPNNGKIITNKTISWPIGLGTGLQGSLSAEENVKFVSRIYGCNNEKLKKNVEYVKEFADIGDYFYEPIKTLSSGMKSRVSFGLSMAFEFDIYLVDEVFAVGDNHFKKKSINYYERKMHNKNIILVSHNVEEIKRMCGTLLLLNKGEIEVYKDIEKGIYTYNHLKKGN